MANHLFELFVFRETPLRAAEWGVGASLLTSSARAIHFIFLLLALMYLDYLGHVQWKTRIIIGVAVFPFRRWSSVGGLVFFVHQHIQHTTIGRSSKVYFRTAQRRKYNIAPANIKLLRRGLQSHYFSFVYLTTCVIHRQGPCTDPSLTYSNCIPPIILGKLCCMLYSQGVKCASTLVQSHHKSLYWYSVLYCGEQDKNATQINILPPKAP